MEWVFVIVGALAGVAMTEIQRAVRDRHRRRQAERHYDQLNRLSRSVETLHEGLVLAQAGWDRDGFFQPGTITVRIAGEFQTPAVVASIRQTHAAEWSERGLTNDRQIGMSAYYAARLTDDPEQERRGLSHQLVLQAHEFDYFDFLAAHRSLLVGTEEERQLLAPLTAAASVTTPSMQLPTPCSVGLSLLAEGGRTLMLTKRAGSTSPAGAWRPGMIYNAVGEGMAVRDFASAGFDASSTSPDVTARRGAYEELGFRPQEFARSSIRLHSFTFATDLLDFKFFGCIETDLSVSELKARWAEAPDRHEASNLIFIPIETKRQVLDLVSDMCLNRSDWAAEALFCTIRTLICLRRVRFEEVAKRLHNATRQPS